MSLRGLLSRVLDCAWPSVDSLNEKSEKAKFDARLAEDLARIEFMEFRSQPELAAAVGECQSLLQRERERRGGVEARLTSALGFGSVASALTATVLAGKFLLEPAVATNARIVVVLICCYTIAQTLCAVLAGIRGLRRRSYTEPKFDSALPRKSEGPFAHARRQLRAYVAATHELGAIVDDKVSHMAVAHCALRNFVAGTALLCVALSAQVWWTPMSRVIGVQFHRFSAVVSQRGATPAAHRRRPRPRPANPGDHRTLPQKSPVRAAPAPGPTAAPSDGGA